MPSNGASRFLLALLALSGCAGGGASTAAAPASSSVQSQATATVNINIPATATAGRARQTITAGTNGILIQSYLHSDTAHANQTGGAFDLSSGSSLCTGSSPRTCAVSITLQAGSSDVVFTTYDAAPVGGSFSSAHQLGKATISSVSVNSGTNSALNVAIGGTVASVSVTPSSQILAGATAGNYALSFTAYDSASEAIVAGATTVTNAGVTQTDVFSNPITYSVSESNGSHTKLSLNGGSQSTSVTAQKSSDSITVYYDGAAPFGYVASIGVSASGATASAPVLHLKQLLTNGDFSADVQGSNSHSFPLTPASWTLVPPYSTGVYNGNDGAGDTALPVGKQAVLIQNSGTGISQTITGLNPGSVYQLSLDASSAGGGTAGLHVTANGTDVTPTNAGSINGTFQTFTTQSFTAPANGQEAIVITDLNNGPNLDVTNVYLI
jgi:hypothetical protein